jgi:hypothetical protein
MDYQPALEIEWQQDGQNYILCVLFEDRGEGREANAQLIVGDWDNIEVDYWGMAEGENGANGIRVLRGELREQDPELLARVDARLDEEERKLDAKHLAWIELSMRQAGLRD